MLQPYALRTEYLVNPIGLDVPKPRFYWKLQGDGHKQAAYRIVVRAGDRTVWDSGRIESDKTAHVEFGGSGDLSPMTRYHWKVEVWDDKGERSESEEAFWETGIGKGDWGAEWISGPLAGSRHAAVPVPRVSKTFDLPGKPVWARLYITALGVYEARLNEHRVGEDLFAPGWTDYRTRVRYQAYDVTEQLAAGDNRIDVLLGDGWYCGHVGMDGRQVYGDRPKVLARLVVRFEEGSEQTVVTGPDWTVAYGPFVESDFLMGESYDSGREWSAEVPVDVVPVPSIEIDDTRHPLPRITQKLIPSEPNQVIHGWPGPRYIFNLGQNIVGRVKVRLKGEKGKTVRLRYAERLDAKGNLYIEALRTAKATDHYTFGEDGYAEYEPTFTFHGFQYVEISGPLAEPPTENSIIAHVIGTPTPPTGTFECSDPLINQLQSNIQWGQRGNFLEVPTDCPQRDERLGWTGDAQVFIRTACHNTDVASFFTKWVQDISDSQTERGSVPAVVPCPDLFGGDGGPAWADATVICPWTIYQCYGDRRILSDHYDTYKGFVDFLERESRDGIRVYEGYEGFRGFGDWLSTKAETPNDLIGTAFLAHSAGILSQMASVLGKDEDAGKYSELRETAKTAFNRRYVTSDGLVASGSQTSYVLALHFDLLPEEKKAEALNMLVTDIGRRGWHLSTGFVGTPYIQHVLTDNGRPDVAFMLLHQKSWPSWLYPVTVGATTIWERWDGWTEDKGFQTPDMNSFNHYAYGAVGEWLYSKVVGLDLLEPGYKKILFRPVPGEGLTHARATLDSIHGPIEAGWSLEGETFRYEVSVPPNATGVVVMPGSDERIDIGPGRYSFEATWSGLCDELKVAAGGANAPE